MRVATLWSVNNSNSFEEQIRERLGYYSRAHKNYLLSQALLGLAKAWAVRFFSFMKQKGISSIHVEAYYLFLELVSELQPGWPVTCATVLLVLWVKFCVITSKQLLWLIMNAGMLSPNEPGLNYENKSEFGHSFNKGVTLSLSVKHIRSLSHNTITSSKYLSSLSLLLLQGFDEWMVSRDHSK